MTFLNDLWKKLKTPRVIKNWHDLTAPATQKTEAIFDTFQDNQTELLQMDSILVNLKALQALLAEPQDGTLDDQFDHINQYLGMAESYELLRQERWPADIHCPHCRATTLQRIPQLPAHSPYHHRYRCLNCQQEFGDETGSPIEADPMPINIWMQCWVLFGITDSLSYIASKLQLDIVIIERMLEQLRNFFQVQHPLEHLLEHPEWSDKTKRLHHQLNENVLQQFELLNQGSVTPKDTVEFRRQQNLRRTLHADTDPSTPSPYAKQKR
jgi:transposase-like protein